MVAGLRGEFQFGDDADLLLADRARVQAVAERFVGRAPDSAAAAAAVVDGPATAAMRRLPEAAAVCISSSRRGRAGCDIGEFAARTSRDANDGVISAADAAMAERAGTLSSCRSPREPVARAGLRLEFNAAKEPGGGPFGEPSSQRVGQRVDGRRRSLLDATMRNRLAERCSGGERSRATRIASARADVGER